MTVIRTPYEAEVNLLADLIISWNAEVRLYRNAVTITKDTVIGDFTQANYTGYSAVTPTWSDAALGSDGRAFSVSSAIVFNAPLIGAQTVYGWYMVYPGGPDLLACAAFAAPIDLDSASDDIDYRIYYTLRQEGGWP